MQINEFASYFVEKKALYGAYPNEERVRFLESIGVTVFVDLTVPGERKCVQYVTDRRIIRFPIPDKSVPDDKLATCKLIIEISDLLDADRMIYVHCKGGHGRSGMIVAALLCYRYDLTPKDALRLTNHYHTKRSGLKSRWEKMGSPQTWSQKQFVHALFRPRAIGTEPATDEFLLETYLGKLDGNDERLLTVRRKRLITEKIILWRQ